MKKLKKVEILFLVRNRIILDNKISVVSCHHSANFVTIADKTLKDKIGRAYHLST